RGVVVERLGGIAGIGSDDDEVTHRAPSGRGAVEADDPAAGRALDGVGLEALAVADVIDVHHLIGQDVGAPQEIGVNGEGAFVGQVGLGDGGPVNFGFKHDTSHINLPREAYYR